MFGLGGTEILLILVIALVILGPKKLPEIAKSLGKGFAEFKRSADDIKESFTVGMEDKKPTPNISVQPQPPEAPAAESNPATPPTAPPSSLEEAEVVISPSTNAAERKE